MNDNIPYILALDISSTHVGLVFYHGAVLDHTEWTLVGDIAERCKLAYNQFYAALERYPQIDVLAVESGGGRNFQAVKQMQRVAGAILALAGQRGIPLIEISPAAAKLALTGRGNVDKCTMMARASAYGVSGEHASDALGVALSACKQIQVVADASV